MAFKAHGRATDRERSWNDLPLSAQGFFYCSIAGRSGLLLSWREEKCFRFHDYLHMGHSGMVTAMFSEHKNGGLKPNRREARRKSAVD